MITGDELLPAASGPFTKALAFAMTDALDVPIRDVMDPTKTPAVFLPFLAAHRSVDLWYGDWSEARRRLMVAMAPQLAALVGTVAAVPAFLSFVDGELLDKISYPRRFVMGRAILGRTPIGHPAFVARHLVKVETRNVPRSLVMGRGALGRTVLRTPSREPLNRCIEAMKVAKAPETESRVDFAHKRALRLSDAVPLERAFPIGAYLDRTRL